MVHRPRAIKASNSFRSQCPHRFHGSATVPFADAGVYLSAQNPKRPWRAQHTYKGFQISLGSYKTEEEVILMVVLLIVTG